MSKLLRYSICTSRTSRCYKTSVAAPEFLDIPDLPDSFLHHLQQVKRRLCRGLPIVHHHGYVCDFPAKHRFAMKKFHGVFRYLRQDNVISSKQVLTPYPVTEDFCSLVHSREYIAKLFNGELDAKEIRKGGFPWSEGMVNRCRLETGGTILAAEVALETGLASSTGGGTHHAFPDHGSGFCMINDMAITAQYLLNKNKVERVLIVDLDVHQGDGTAFIFQNEPRVFTFSMHCQKNFPFMKQKSNLDIGLENHTKDDEYMRSLSNHLPDLLDSFRPDIVIYDAGVDPHVRDELGNLDLTDRGLYDRDNYVIELCQNKGVPCVTVIGGGYCRDHNELSRRHSIVHRVASKIWCENEMFAS